MNFFLSLFFLNNVSLALFCGCSRLLVCIFIPSEWMRYICINYWFTWAYLCNSELKTLAAYLIDDITRRLELPTTATIASWGVKCPFTFIPEHLQIELYPIQNFKNRSIVTGSRVCFLEKIMPVLVLNERQGFYYSRDIKADCFFEKTNLL